MSPIRRTKLSPRQGKLNASLLRYIGNTLTAIPSCLERGGLLPTALQILPLTLQRSVAAQCIKKAAQLKLDLRTFVDDYHSGEDTHVEFVCGIVRYSKLRPYLFRAVSEAFIAHHANRSSGMQDTAVEARLESIRSMWDLDSDDLDLLRLCYYKQSDDLVDGLFDSVREEKRVRTYGTFGMPMVAGVILGKSSGTVTRLMDSGAPLRRLGLLDSDGDLPNEITNYLNGVSKKPISTRYFSEFTGAVIPLEKLTAGTVNIDTLRTLLSMKNRSKGVSIFLYGVPGTGKTELAHSLGRELGLETWDIADIRKERGEDDKEDWYFRHRAYMACQRKVDPKKSLIIIDEADAMINDYHGKGVVNRMIDQVHIPTIWISNDIMGIHPSVMRRFDYSIGFERFNHDQRRSVWETAVARYRLGRAISPDDIAELAEHFEVNAGGIDVALRNAAAIWKETKSRPRTKDTVVRLLKAHQKVTDPGALRRDPRKSLARSYSLEGLNISGGLERSLTMAEVFSSQWKGEDDDVQLPSFNMLLYGPPGSGKTEFARYIARHLKRRLIVKKASDLLGPFVGMTEQLIREAFNEAETSRAILFIDEADSFFAHRSEARQSWEITQVNELLTNMETFRGMLLCCTNFKEALDPAAMRRFSAKLEFGYLKPAGVLHFHTIYFADLLPAAMSESETLRLSKLAFLTPGDFKTVRQQADLMGNETLSHTIIIDELFRETELKNEAGVRKIGFGK